MLTVQQVYDMTIKLMDEQNDSTGATNSSELNGYKNRALALINVLVSDLYNISDLTSFGDTTKPVPLLLTDFTDGIDLDDRLAVNVLPFGLASLFLRNEGSEGAALSAFFWAIYQKNKTDYAKKKPTAKVAITNKYGSFSRKTDGSIDEGGDS